MEAEVDRLLDTAVALIPNDSLIARLIGDVRDWHAAAGGAQWRQTFARIRGRYGYDRYGGNCHVVPNHALIIMALLAGGGDFDRSLTIVNTAGWDTDCNSGNVGCLLGIRGGLAAVGERWRAPVADRLYLPSADAGEAVTDATRVADRLVALGHRLAGAEPPAAHARKGGARFHFEYPGSVQGFRAASGEPAMVANAAGHSATGSRALAVRFPALATDRHMAVTTPTGFPSDPRLGAGYGLHGSPTLHPGQLLRLGAAADAGNRDAITLTPVPAVAMEDGTEHLAGPALSLAPGAGGHAEWTVPETGGNPVVEAGVRIAGPAAAGTVYLDYLDWRGVPRAHLGRPGRQRRGDDPGRGAARRPCRRAATPYPHRRRRDHYRQRWRPACAVRVRRDLRRRRRGSTLHGRPYRSERRAHRPAAGDTRDLARAPRGSLQGAYLTYFSHCALADSNCSISTRREWSSANTGAREK